MGSTRCRACAAYVNYLCVWRMGATDRWRWDYCADGEVPSMGFGFGSIDGFWLLVMQAELAGLSLRMISVDGVC